MVDFAYYQSGYHGRRIPSKEEFAAPVARAAAKLAWFERTYTITYPTPAARQDTLCALADEYYITEQAAAGSEERVKSQSTGSVSTSYDLASADRLLETEKKRLGKALRLYADVYRGTRR